MRERTWRLLIELLLAAALLVAGLRVFGEAVERVSFHGDEGMNIGSSRYFGYLFLEQDLARPEWGDNFWTHTQPMLIRYLIGSSVWYRGYDLDDLPMPYDASKSFEQNRREGRVPDEALLIQARAPMVPLAAAGVALLYLLGRALGGVVAGLTAALLALASPPYQVYLMRAVGEAPLVFLLLLALLLGILGARRGRHGGLPIGWAIALGVALGLGLANKLTAVLSLAAIVAWGTLVAVAVAARRADEGRGARDAWAAGRGWALAAAIAFAVFVVSNPHLYPNPFLHTAHLFAHRASEGPGLQRANPELALYAPGDRASFVLRESVGRTLTGSLGVPLETALAVVGAAGLLVRARRGWRETGHPPVEGLILLTALAYVLGVTAFLNLALIRYLVPILIIGTLFSGLGLSVLIDQLSTIGARPAPREPVDERAAVRP